MPKYNGLPSNDTGLHVRYSFKLNRYIVEFQGVLIVALDDHDKAIAEFYRLSR